MSRVGSVVCGTFLCIALLGGCHGIAPLAEKTPTPANHDLTEARKIALPRQSVEATTPPIIPFSNVLSPELPKRPITIAECIALALENGRTGEFFDGAEGRQKTSVTGVRPYTPVSSTSDAIRVFAHDPAAAGMEIEESLARFDVWSDTGLFWNRIDQKNRFLNLTDPFQQVTAQNKLDRYNFQSSLFKRLPTGALAGVQFITDAERNYLVDNNSVINPAVRPRMDLFFEQPLLQGSGLLINQLRDFAPVGYRRNYPDNGKAPGILLVRITHKQTQLEFERQVHELIFRVEEAYWKLQSAYWNFYASDNGMKQALSAWQVAKARFDAGGIGIEDLAMMEEQLHFFRNERMQALGTGQPGRPGVLEAERYLRYVVGLPPEDGCRLTPADSVVYEAYEPNLEESVAEAQTYRPELRQVDQEIEAAHLGILKAEDRLQPDLLFVGKYGVNGLGNNIGSGLEDLVSHPRDEWEVGLRLQFPLGFRAGHADVTRARINLSQRMYYLKDQREKLIFSLQRSHRDLIQHREQYKIRQSQRITAARQLKVRLEKFDVKAPGSNIDLLLRAQRNWVDALREEYVALCQYRTSIVDFERQKGTVLQFANVTITEGPMLPDALPSASKFFRERKNANLSTSAVVENLAEAASVLPPALPAMEPAPLPTPPARLGLPVSP